MGTGDQGDQGLTLTLTLTLIFHANLSPNFFHSNPNFFMLTLTQACRKGMTSFKQMHHLRFNRMAEMYGKF